MSKCFFCATENWRMICFWSFLSVGYGNSTFQYHSSYFFHTLKANAENGAMQFVKGTHKNGFYDQVRSQKSGNVLSDNLEIDIKPEWKDKIIQTQLVSGQCSFHDGTVLKIALLRCICFAVASFFSWQVC